MAEKKESQYSILPEFIGKVAWAPPPTYPRKDSGMFVLDDKLSQKDLGYLYEVCKYEGVVKG